MSIDILGEYLVSVFS